MIGNRMFVFRPRGPFAMLLGVAGAAVIWSGTPRAQEPTFRAGVDVVAVDVQVVDGSGTPIRTLAPKDFNVEIGGHKRKVVSANYVESADLPTELPTGRPRATNILPDDPPTDHPNGGRLFVMAIDENSFNVGDSRGVVAAAQSFVQQLTPEDRVGLYAFPFGPNVDPTADHRLVERRLDTIVGHKQPVNSEYNLSPLEVIDITAEVARAVSQNTGSRTATVSPAQQALQGDDNGGTLRRVQLRECGAIDTACAESIETEVQMLAFYYEGQVTQSLYGLRNLVQNLQNYPGRKTVVVMSGGMVVSDRPGGRPDVGDLPKLLGQEAAEANTTIYALHVDTSFFESSSAEARKTDVTPVAHGRDYQVLGRLLDEFSGASGGALLPVLVGHGDTALNRVLRETSSHYLLGVEPTDSDRDGKLRPLRVKVAMDGATVRSRMWVVVPKKSQAAGDRP